MEFSNARLRELLQGLDGLGLQEREKQARFKLSFYCDVAAMHDLVAALEMNLRSVNAPWHVIASADPFNGDGLIDLLLKGVHEGCRAFEFFRDQKDS